ncbi:MULTISPECIES: P-II family nitrogen regulator [Acidithiobacillus]|uniref:P-II family nitrogen regulator n=1 Tax=Acidithiobacillus ferruginosus TaxID=3063951 RepID=A0ACD5IEN5_9PROT|nr:P-II family nitrogen regulator [Acidithiobacillus ferruginosus]MBU2815053.1 hypothetical protein [Acidithiobacillus ferruginosus]
MKLITAIVKPFKLDDVREALASIGIQRMAVTEVIGFDICCSHAYVSDYIPRIKIEVVTSDQRLDHALAAVIGEHKKGPGRRGMTGR